MKNIFLQRTLRAALQFISEEIKPDVIIWTGDNTAHDVWHQNSSTQTVPTKFATEYIKEFLPNVPLFPIFGNHECFPGDQYDFYENKTAWLIDQVTQIWADVIDAEGSLYI